MLLQRMAALALAAWFGGGIVAGFIAPQVAFGILEDRQLAGSVAGGVLTRFAYLSLALGTLYAGVWLSTSRRARMPLYLVLGAMLVTGASQFWLSPEIAALRDMIHSTGATPQLSGRFGMLHSLSMLLFALQWLLVTAALVLHLRSAEHSTVP